VVSFMPQTSGMEITKYIYMLKYFLIIECY